MPTLDLPERPWLVGHRGVREVAPENTAASVREAVEQGADMVEIDLQLTRDGQLVVYHDQWIGDSRKEDRRIGVLTLEQVKRCRPVWSHAGRGRAYEVATLAEVLEATPEGLPLNLEIKRYGTGRDPSELAGALGRAIADRDQVLVSSFDGAVLVAVRKSLPDLPLAPLGRRTGQWQALVELARRLEAFSIHVDRRLAGALGAEGLLDDPEVEGRPILAYTVNDAAEAEQLLRFGVSGFFTDHPGALRAQLESPE